MSNIIQDIHEPDDMERMLSMFMQVKRHNLEPLGLCDYMWFAADSHQITLERKTWFDFMDMKQIGRLENQLNKALKIPKEVGLIVEGIALPLAGGETAIYKPGRKEGYLRLIKIFPTKYDFVMAFLWRLDKEGITVYHTPTIEATAWALKAFVENSQKPEFTTLKRYARLRTTPVWQPNPMIEMIMAVKDDKGWVVGEKRATEMVKKYGNLYDLLNTPPGDIAIDCNGVSIATARRFINAAKGKTV